MKKVSVYIVVSLLLSSGMNFAMLSPATVPNDPTTDASVQSLTKARTDLDRAIKELENYARRAGTNTQKMLRPIINRLKCSHDDLRRYNPAQTIDFEKNSSCKVR